tara:strand:+ start:99 stop:1040 length:942 start_codon:yes stop_codon:yes gene_type:complete
MDLTSRNILVAGASGLIGRAVVKCFGEAGCKGVLTPSHSELDLEDASQVTAFFQRHKPDVVVLAAGKVGGILENKSKPVEFLTRNLAIQMNVCAAADLMRTSRVVLFGSSCMYPKECPQPMREDMLGAGKLEPTSLSYATAKIAGLQLGFSYNQQRNIDRFLCVIPNSAYGPGDNFDPQSGHVLSSLIHKFHVAKLAAADHVALWGTGAPRREFVFSADIADALLFLLNQEVTTQHMPINIGSGHDISIADLATQIAAVVGFDGKIVWQTDKPDGTLRKLLDSERLLSMGWKPKTDLQAGLEDTYRWYLANAA